MNDAEYSGYVNQAMQTLPALSAEAANPAGRGRDGERNQQQKGGEAHSNEGTLRDVVHDLRAN